MLQVKLSHEELTALNMVDGGGRIYSDLAAVVLKKVKRKYPSFLDIEDSDGEPNIWEQLPYFKATLTDEGRRAVTGVTNGSLGS